MGHLKINSSDRAEYASGFPAEYAQKYIYAAGTDRLVKLYSDSNLTFSQANPVKANASGYFPSLYVMEGSYRVVVRSLRGDVLFEQEQAQVIAGVGELPEDFSISTLEEIQAARNLAQQWAEEPEDSEVTPGQFSAFHHAAKAEVSAATSVAALTATETARDAANGAASMASTAASQALSNSVQTALDRQVVEMAVPAQGAPIRKSAVEGRALVADGETHLVSGLTGIEVYERVNSSTSNRIGYLARNVYVTPDQFGAPASGDMTAAVQAALNSGYPVFLNRRYNVTSVHFPARDGVILHGAGNNKSGLVGTDANAPYVLCTCDLTSAAYQGRHDVRNFSIAGDGRIGLLVCQTITSTFDNVKMLSGNAPNPNAFRGTGDQYVFEFMDSCTFNQLEGSGLPTGGATFKVNRTCLNSEWNMCYTNNVFDRYSLDIDSSRTQSGSLLTATGHGRLIFNHFTAQGAKRYAIKAIASEGPITFNTIYMENSLSGIFSACTELYINQTRFTVPVGGAAHAIWIDKTDYAAPVTTRFSGCKIINNKKIIVGNANEVQWDQDIFQYVERASTTYVYESFDTRRTHVSFGPSRDGTNHRTNIGLKCEGVNGLHTRFSINEAGTINVETPAAFPNTTETPRTLCMGFYGSSSPTYASGVAITPITVRAAGFSANGLTSANYVYGHTGALPPGLSINATTGALEGTPTTPGTYYMRFSVTDGTETALSRGCNITVT